MLLLFTFCVCAAVLVEGNNSPVLIWSPSRPLKDLPQSYAGHTVGTEKFGKDYLAPLTTDGKHNTVVFLQDTLSLEDFTHHADVYNPTSDGGAFKNIKVAMDDQFSIHLSAVKHPQEAIDTAVSSFPGEIHRVDNSDQLESLELKEGKTHLILVTLPSTRGKEDSKAFAENDAMMGRCMHHLNKRGIKYTAVYTAMSEEQADAESVHQGRHLLADKDNKTSGTFMNSTSLMLFLKSVNLTAEMGEERRTTNILAEDGKIEMKDSIENNTLTVNISITNTDVSLGLSMVANESYAREWMVREGRAVVAGKNGNWTVFDAEVDLKMDTVPVTAPFGFGFHCSNLGPVVGMTSKNESEKQNQTKLFVTLVGFQIQPFFDSDNSSHAQFSGDVWDCVPFFTIPIWMGIISTVLLMIILFFGLTMITNITTMDRFDDPKGKTITINVNE